MSQTVELEVWVPDTTRTGRISYNQAIEDLADALALTLSIDASSYATPYTIPYGPLDTDPKTALRFMKLKVTGALSAGWTAYVPAKEHLFIIENATTGGHSVTVMVQGQTGIAVASATKSLAFCNGTDVELVGGAGGGSGTVTSVTAGVGLTGGVITTSGTIDLTVPVTVAHGGTGVLTLAAHGVVVGAGSSAVAVTSAGTSGNVLTSNGASADPTFQAAPVVSVNGQTGTVTLALASSDFANQGTTTTVLHGNAAGNPSFAAVSLANDVTGNLGVSHLNGGTSASSSTFWRGDGSWATPAGSGTVTSVGISSTDLSVSGSPVTGSGSITLDVISGAITNAKLASMVTHTIKGNATGSTAAPTDMTGTTTTALLDAVVGDSGSGGTKGLVPAPASGDAAAGKFLKADGTWATVSGAAGGTVTSVATGTGLTGGTITSTGTIALASIADHDLLANTSGGSAAPVATTLTALIDNAIASTQGDILYRNATAWVALAPGSSGNVLQSGGASANPSWAAAGGTGTVTSVATGTGLTGGTITGTGTISLAAIANHDVLANTSGGSAAPVATTLTALIDDAIGSTQGNILYRGASSWSVLAPGTSGQRLKTQGAAANPVWDDEPFDIACYYGTSVLTSLNIGLRFTAARAISFPANFGTIVGGTSHATASVAATASTVFNVDKAASGSENTWTTIGTVTYGVAGVTGSFATTGGATQSLAAGDSLRIISPSTPDATLAGVSITLAGSR